MIKNGHIVHETHQRSTQHQTNIPSKTMPATDHEQELELEFGTITAVAKRLKEQGLRISYEGVLKRIKRKSHPETLRMAIAESKRLKREREERAAEIREIVQQANAKDQES